MRNAVLLLLLVYFAQVAVLSAQSPARLPDRFEDFYRSNKVFALRDAPVQGFAPTFYTGVVEASANLVLLASKDLHAMITAEPHSTNAARAYKVLASMYHRNGMYPAALRELRSALQEHPKDAELLNALPLFSALADLPPPRVLKRKHSTLKLERGSLSLPLEIDGKRAQFFFDTGAAISVIGQSEAKRLGLEIGRVDGRLSDASGVGLSGLHLALVRNLVIGGLHMRNVPFVVLDDTGEPWNQMSQDQRGIIALPVLIAMRTIRWKPAGSFEFGFPPAAFSLAKASMLFHETNPVVPVKVKGKQFDFSLDTGAVDTDLNPPFADALPDLVKTGQPETRSIMGLGGTDSHDSVLLPSVTFELGGRTLSLRPAHVFTKKGLGTWAAGNLGMDLLLQSHAVTIDFSAMTLQLD